VTITCKRHAFEGKALAVIRTIRRRSIHHLLAALPDGSRSLIPASRPDWCRRFPVTRAGREPILSTRRHVQEVGQLL
jgi:hypothetical protein